MSGGMGNTLLASCRHIGHMYSPFSTARLELLDLLELAFLRLCM